MAKKSIKIIDTILAPREYILIKYKGKEPFTSVRIAIRVLRKVMKIPGSKVYEDHIKWDITGDPVFEFYGIWRGTRDEDRWTSTWIKIIIQGAYNKNDRMGWCNIWIKGHIETSYNYSNAFHRMFWLLFDYIFYYKQRRAYLEYAKQNILDIRDEFKSALGIK